MRLDKFIGNNSSLSRTDIRKLIKAKRIEVNHQLANNSADKIEPEYDQVFIDGERIKAIGLIYVMLNKPKGYVCANRDSEHPTVLDLVLQQAANVGANNPIGQLPLCDLQIVGRLDIDTTGLVLITNDGDWNHRITSPHSRCKKHYTVKLAQTIGNDVQHQFMRGVQLEGEQRLTRPALMQPITHNKATLILQEGKYHQVKRMFAATGNKVIELHRDRIGAIALDTTLGEGEFRFLTAEEVASVTAAI